MKLTGRAADANLFSAPTMLRKDTPFLGATVGVWDAAMTHNMQQKLDQIKKLATTSPKRDVNDAKTFDVASVAAQLLMANTK